MKLCGSGDCACYVESSSPHFHIRGSGDSDTPLAIDWLLLPRGAPVSMSAQGTRFWVDGSGRKVFRRLPIVLHRLSAVQSIVSQRLTYWTGLSNPVGDTVPPPSELITDPEFEPVLDAAAGALGIVKFISAYDGYRMMFEPLGIQMTTSSRETGTPIVASSIDGRNLWVRPQNLAGFETGADIRCAVGAHGATKRSAHRSKARFLRLPFHATRGNSWSFMVQQVSNAGNFGAIQPRKLNISIYGLWSAFAP